MYCIVEATHTNVMVLTLTGSQTYDRPNSGRARQPLHHRYERQSSLIIYGGGGGD